jgi:hypothetical protein
LKKATTPEAPQHLVEALKIGDRELISVRIPSQEEVEENDTSPRKFTSELVFEIDEEKRHNSFDEERVSDATLEDFKKDQKKTQYKRDVGILSKDPQIPQALLENEERVRIFFFTL